MSDTVDSPAISVRGRRSLPLFVSDLLNLEKVWEISNRSSPHTCNRGFLLLCKTTAMCLNCTLVTVTSVQKLVLRGEGNR